MDNGIVHYGVVDDDEEERGERNLEIIQMNPFSQWGYAMYQKKERRGIENGEECSAGKPHVKKKRCPATSFPKAGRPPSRKTRKSTEMREAGPRAAPPSTTTTTTTLDRIP